MRWVAISLLLHLALAAAFWRLSKGQPGAAAVTTTAAMPQRERRSVSVIRFTRKRQAVSAPLRPIPATVAPEQAVLESVAVKRAIERVARKTEAPPPTLATPDRPPGPERTPALKRALADSPAAPEANILAAEPEALSVVSNAGMVAAAATPRVSGTPGPRAASKGEQAWGRYKTSVFSAINAQQTYPRQARLRRREGTVGVRFGLDRVGRIANVEITKRAESQLLNRAARKLFKDVRLPDPPQEVLGRFPVSMNITLEYALDPSQRKQRQTKGDLL